MSNSHSKMTVQMYTKHCSKFSFAVQQSIMVVVTKAFVLCWNFVGTTPLLWWEASTLERTLSLSFSFCSCIQLLQLLQFGFSSFVWLLYHLLLYLFQTLICFLFPCSFSLPIIPVLLSVSLSLLFAIFFAYNERPHETLSFLFNVLSIIQQIFCSSPFLSFPNTVTLLCLFCPFVYDAFYLFLSLSPRVD